MLVLKTVIYKSKRLDFQNFTSLVLDDFKKTLDKKRVFFSNTNYRPALIQFVGKCRQKLKIFIDYWFTNIY